MCNSSKRIVLVVSALEEELASTVEYFAKTYTRGISKSEHEDFFIVDDATEFILCTSGYGKNSSYQNTKRIMRSHSWTELYYMGCCLGISSNLKRGDVVNICKTWDDLNIEREVFARNENNNFGVAITGDNLIRINTRFAVSEKRIELLPHKVQDIIRVIRAGSIFKIVYDMESAFVVRAFQEYQFQTKKKVSMKLMRVVLDTIYDTKKINFCEDIKEVSDISLKEFRNVYGV